ncbi:MAG TPA: hypothetical protein VGL71_10210, partial [Urbifossiella sp.]
IPGVGFNFHQSGGFGVPGFGYSYNLSGPVGFGIAARMFNQIYPPTSYNYGGYGGYMSGGTGGAGAANRNFARAQQQAAYAARATPVPARNAIYDQWAYEKFDGIGLPGVKAGEEAPAALIKALNGATEAEVASGESLNHIVVGIVAAEKKGRANSAFLPPNLLNQVRFSGSPAAEAINLIRQVGKLQFPKAFDNEAFAEVRPALEKDLAAVAGPTVLGKAVDPAKVAKLQADVAKARAILDPLTRNLEFADATAARRFLNQLETTVSVLKGGNGSGLIDPRWATEGTSVADLVKHLIKNKLLFGPVPKGEEEAYLALHRGLAAYLFVLNESQKPAVKK